MKKYNFRSMQASIKDAFIDSKKGALNFIIFTSYNCDILVKYNGVVIPLYNHDYSTTTSKQATIYSGIATNERRARYNYLMQHCDAFRELEKHARFKTCFNLISVNADIIHDAILQAYEAIKANSNI